jgi:hypothetical protein
MLQRHDSFTGELDLFRNDQMMFENTFCNGVPQQDGRGQDEIVKKDFKTNTCNDL